MSRNLGLYKIIDTLSALNAQGLVPYGGLLERADWVSFYVLFKSGTTSGTVLIEGSHDALFAGTWATLGTVAWAADNRVHNVAIAGNHLALRARISVVIGVGTVDVWASISG